MFRRGTKRPRFSLSGHLVFEHDDSSNHSGLGMNDYEEDSSSQQHTTSTNNFDSNILFNHLTPERPRRVVQRPITKPQNDDNTNLTACLDHLLRILSRKDKEGFFQYPVTDQFAPGYSTIITRPMDFSTMRKKINQDEYSNTLEFRSDFELMCENAMKYNRPDTVYWQAAKKLLGTGSKLMSNDKLINFRPRLSERELGFRIDSSNHTIDESITTSNDQYDLLLNENENFSSNNSNQTSTQRKPKLILKLPKYYEKTPTPVVIPDVEQEQQQQQEEEEEEELSPEEILSQAQQAAQIAHEKLNHRRSITSYTLAYQRINNITSLRFENQNDFSQQIIPINEFSSNENSLPIIHENDKRYYLENGPFSSNTSQYDIPFASISKDEIDLLIHTYGSEFSAQYAVSLMDYVKDSGDLALAYVDRFLSVLTNGEHDNFIIKKREKQQKQEENDNKTIETISTNSNQIKLEPQIHEDNNLPHSTNEYELAEKDLFNLSDMTQISNGPDQLISSENIHHNLSMMNNIESTFDTL